MMKNAEVAKKICLIGEGAVGKTSLIKRFILDIFDDKYLRTLGTKVSKKIITIEHPEKASERDLTLLIWDIMGQKGFMQLLQEQYFYGAHGLIAVCDVTKKDTLKELRDWIDSAFTVTGNIPVLFLANKIDLKDSMEIDENMLKSFASKYDVPYLYTSAKTGENVETAFHTLGKLTIAGSE